MMVFEQIPASFVGLIIRKIKKMDYLNSHIHFDGINSERLEQMYFSGIRELVSPAM